MKYRPLDRLAFTVSALTSPFVTITLFGLWVIAAQSDSLWELIRWGAPFVALPILLPFLYILIEVRRGSITDLHVMVREQRSVPFAVANAGSLLLLAYYSLTGAPRELVALAAALLLNGLAFWLLTARWKVSIHSAALCGSTVIVGTLVNPRLLGLLLLLPLVSWARVHRGRHDVPQALAAAVVVSVLTYLVLRFLI